MLDVFAKKFCNVFLRDSQLAQLTRRRVTPTIAASFLAIRELASLKIISTCLAARAVFQ
jgi:hypothetical protein